MKKFPYKLPIGNKKFPSNFVNGTTEFKIINRDAD